jgi:hypothetical protein
MTSVADALRAERAREALALTPGERVALATRLGAEGIDLLMSSRNVSREEAVRLIRAGRRAGRAPSACHDTE